MTVEGTQQAARPRWFDPSLPPAEQCVLAYQLSSAVQECPKRVFAVFEDGSSWTYEQIYERTRRRAGALSNLGLGRDDRLLAWLPNDRECLLNWFAANWLGACFVPINPAYRGDLLAHVIDNSDARIMVTHPQLAERLSGVNTAQLTTVISSRVPDNASSGLQWHSTQSLDESASYGEPEAGLTGRDLQAIIFTSGTTGPSKGALSSYFHQYTIATVLHGHMSADDRIFVNGPLFHIGGTGAVLAALIYRGSIALIDGFSVQRFWALLQETGATMTSGLLGSMAPFLASAASGQDRTDNRLRMTHFYPVNDDTLALADSCCFDFFTGYGMTEAPMLLISDVNSRTLGSCGRPRSGVEVKLVDAKGREVPTGEAGELVARSLHEGGFSDGYHRMPAETNRAWRDGWFHSGDLLRRDEAGDFFFVDRKKDAIRRRGENISSFEVERAVCSHPAVEDAAAYGVSSEFGEEDVMVAVQFKRGKDDDLAKLFIFLKDRLPHFMLPRYMRVLQALPRTPTDKIQKHVLREQGVGPDGWDRVAQGMDVKRERLF